MLPDISDAKEVQKVGVFLQFKAKAAESLPVFYNQITGGSAHQFDQGDVVHFKIFFLHCLESRWVKERLFRRVFQKEAFGGKITRLQCQILTFCFLEMPCPYSENGQLSEDSP